LDFNVRGKLLNINFILFHQGWGDEAGAILFFLQEPEHFKKLKWSRSWHKLVRLQSPAVF